MFTTDDLQQLETTSVPVLTWYGQDGRIEFLGKQLAQWIIKTANFLGEASGEDPTWVATFQLPASWRTLIWCAAADLCTINYAHHPQPSNLDFEAADLLVTSDAEVAARAAAAAPTAMVLVQALGPLATGWSAPLPEGVEDAIAAVSAQPDLLVTTLVEGYRPPRPSSVTVTPTSVLIPAAASDWRQQCLRSWRNAQRAVWIDAGLDHLRIRHQEGI